MAEPESLRDVFGRGMSRTSDVYKLPVDAEERDRLNVQHLMWKALIGGLYPLDAEEAVASALSTVNGIRPAILDVGSGSGVWAVEMARKYPQADVVGIDLTESKPSDVPQNCRFAVEDAMGGLAEYHGRFNLLHCRSVVGHVSDGVSLIRTMGNLLKPGGVLLLVDGTGGMYKGLEGLYPPAAMEPGVDNVGKSWMSRFFEEAVGRMGSTSMTERMRLGQLGDCVSEDGQCKVVGRKYYRCPVGWTSPEVPNGEEVGKLMGRAIYGWLGAGRPLLLSGGLPAETVEKLIQKAGEEILDPEFHLTIKWQYVWARKGDE